jgi:arylsulfatase A-like enzyme
MKMLSGAAMALLLVPLVLTDACTSRVSRPSFIWIVVDTLRADHLEWYGYSRTTMPSLHRLVNEGVQFDRAYSSLPATSPSISSMMTGAYPYRHGVQQLYIQLNEHNMTVAKYMKALGYDTAAFVSSTVMVREFSNFGPGFDVYDDYVDERERFRDNYERRAERTLAQAELWLAAHRDRPFFCFIHLIDPHGPYTPPGRFAQAFHSKEAEPITGDKILQYQRIPGVTNANVYRDLYDGEIAYASFELGRFFSFLDTAGLFDPSLIIFNADHGEEMGEHGFWFRHGDDLYEQNLHVPLIIKPPQGDPVARGSRVSAPVSVVDILPTAIEALGRQIPRWIEGQSLMPWVSGPHGFARPEPHDAFAELHLGPRSEFALVRGHRKTLSLGDHWLQFDLDADPAEAHSLPASERDEAAYRDLQAWGAHALGWKRDFVPTITPLLNQRANFVRNRHSTQTTDETLRQLRSLGYL